MDHIQGLLFNLLCIIVPIFLFQIFWEDRLTGPPMRAGVSVFLLTSASLLLCMAFPLQAHTGFYVDLRLVPFILGTLYGGLRLGAPMLALVIAYRWWLGGTGFLFAAVDFTVLLLIVSAFAPRFQRSGRWQKTGIAVMLMLLESVFAASTILAIMDLPLGENPMLGMLIVFVLLNLLATCLAVYLIENMVEKNRMRQEIQRAEKLHMLGELTASIAHEIRNPLTVVNGFLQLLRENDKRIEEDKRQMYLKMGIDELDRAEKIIANYLAFARPQHESVQQVDIGERVHHVASIITSYAILRNVEIEKQAEEGLFVQADPEKISQVLMNLLKNGIEAMPVGGTLTIQAARADDRIQIQIRDNGVGMSEAETARLGVPYYSTKEAGTGLGLMVCYQIIHSLGGAIHVTSEKHKGTQFRILLPSV